MNRLLLGVAVAVTPLALAAPAQAQRNAAATILVVDAETVFSDCTACRAASTALQTQVQQAQQLAQQLAAPLQTEGQQIQTAVDALNGRAPDAALQKRVTDFQARQTQANQQLAQRENAIRSTQAHVNQQIGARVGPILEQIRNSRGALVVLNKNNTLANAANVEITNEVLAQLNQQLPAVSVTPLPQQARPAQQTTPPAGQTGR